MDGPSERERVVVRAEVRRYLKRLIQEAKRQKCFEEIQQMPELFVAFLLSHDAVMIGAVASGMVTLHDLCTWLNVLLYGADEHGEEETICSR
jgi:hypothetical protein